jgi:hypothetical protein
MRFSVLRRCGVSFFLLLILVSPGISHLFVRAQDDRALVFFDPVRGVINDATPAEDWVFAAYRSGDFAAGVGIRAILTRSCRLSGQMEPSSRKTTTATRWSRMPGWKP